MKQVVLGSLGERYLREVLDEEIGLCAVMRSCPLSTGIYSTFVPEDKPDDQVENLRSGGLLIGDEGEHASLQFIDHLRNKYGLSGAGTLVVQSPWAHPADALPRNADDTLLLEAGLGVCHLSPVADLTLRELYFLIGDIVGVSYLVCVLDKDPAVDWEIVRDQARLSAHIVAAFVPAYDGESFMLWERS